MKVTNSDLRVVGPTIRSVATNLSSHYRTTELEGDEVYSALVFTQIRAAVAIALYKAGIPIRKIVSEIDPSDEIIARMIKDGYKFSTDFLKRPEEFRLR